MENDRFDRLDELRKIVIYMAGRFKRKETAEYLENATNELSAVSLRTAREFLEACVAGQESFPSIARIRSMVADKRRTDALNRSLQKSEGQAPASLVRVHGTPATWEALFILIDTIQTQGGAFQLARNGKSLWSDEEIWAAYYEWKEGRVSPMILERRSHDKLG